MNLDLMSTLYYVGYAFALILYRDMGRIFFIPMLFNMVFNILLNLNIFFNFDIRYIAAIQGLLFYVWIAFIIRSDRKALDMLVAMPLAIAVFFFFTLPDLRREASTVDAMIDITSNIWTIWDAACFILTFMVLLRSSLIAWMRKEFIDVLTNPRKRFLIPICLFNGIVGVEPLLRGIVPPEILAQRFNIGSMVLAWGWVAVELPFYIMYERLKRKYG